jgi:hypothetical protein
MALLKELGIETYKQYISGTKFMQVGSKNKISTYQSDIPSLPLLGLLDMNKLMKLVGVYLEL